MPKHYLAACAMHKLEGNRLREWIEYHRLVGFEHFYLFDNNDEDDGSAEIVRPYIADGIVTSQNIRGNFPFQQMQLYDQIIRRKPAAWVAFIDIDEFILPIKTNNVAKILPEFESYAGLAINWRCFGTSGNVASPKFILESCTRASTIAFDVNLHVKSIVRPDRIVRSENAHQFITVPGSFVVNENHQRVTGAFSPFSDNKLVVNHYVLRSIDDFKIKSLRGRGDGLENPYDQAYFQRMDRNEVEEPRIASRIAAEVRRRCEGK